MRYEVRQKPDFGIVRVVFDAPGEQLLVESAAMVARDTAMEMKTAMTGGILGAAKRKLLGGESIFQNTFTATAAGQTLWVAPGPEVGRVLQAVYERQLDGAIATSEEARAEACRILGFPATV